MPIVDVEFVCEPRSAPACTASALAAAVGRALGTPPGRTWVRLRVLDTAAYAENEVAVPAAELPVFVTLLHARPPAGAALAAEIASVTAAVAACAGRPPERVHLQYAPAAAGRQAFGGTLVE